MSTEVKKRGHRPVYFSCVAVHNGQAVEEKICTREKGDAVQAFTTKLGVAPTLVIGPYYDWKGVEGPAERVTVAMKASDVRFTGKRWSGIYRGWKVVANGLGSSETYGDNEVVHLNLEENGAVDGASRPRFGPAKPYVLLSEIEEANEF